MSAPTKFRIGGKTIDLPEADPSWKFTPRAGGWCIAERTLKDGTVERMRLMAEQVGDKVGFHSKGQTFSGEWVRKSRASARGESANTGLIAQFPGKVRKVLVAADQSVKEGESLLLVEAMKMEFTIKAPSDGKVRKVLVKEGEQLSPGKELIDFVAAEAKAEKK